MLVWHDAGDLLPVRLCHHDLHRPMDAEQSDCGGVFALLPGRNVYDFLYSLLQRKREKTIAEHKAEITKISVEQQKKELEALRRNEQEIRLLHHDMRLFLSSLSVCLEEGNADKAKEQVALYLSRMPSTKVQHFCKIDTINYILSDFAAKCQAEKVAFVHKVELDALPFDINMVAAILSNALDNALNAQKPLEESQRSVKLLLKTANNKLLLSVENPVAEADLFL